MKLSNPFSCGTRVLDWKERNCHRCKLGYDEKNEKWNCDLEGILDYGLNTTSEFTEYFLKKIGYNKKTKDQLTWDCPKKEVT